MQNTQTHYMLEASAGLFVLISQFKSNNYNLCFSVSLI